MGSSGRFSERVENLLFVASHVSASVISRDSPSDCLKLCPRFVTHHVQPPTMDSSTQTQRHMRMWFSFASGNLLVSETPQKGLGNAQSEDTMMIWMWRRREEGVLDL